MAEDRRNELASELEDYQRREAEARVMAADAATRTIRDINLKLAENYALLAEDVRSSLRKSREEP